MRVFKFGGASVKDANGVQNLAGIVKERLVGGDVVVVSAMGKTTANLEEIANRTLNDKEGCEEGLSQVSEYHEEIVRALFEEAGKSDRTMERIDSLFHQIRFDLANFGKHHKKAFIDRILAYGEILSTSIIAGYVQEKGIAIVWKDIRQFIRSDDHFGSARVDWLTTVSNLEAGLPERDSIVITQGYIASTAGGMTTTLGKEGSDFTAAIIARACRAADVTFWKDVPGVFNADPKQDPEAVLFGEMAYREVVELTYYGAKIIHPKTMKPLAEADIPLYVRSFLQPEKPGTRISREVAENQLSQTIFKYDQVLVSFKIDNLEFIGENNIGMIFYTFDRLGIQVNIMQSSASSFTFAFDWDEERMERLIETITPMNKFSMYFNKGLTLVTFKNTPEEKVAGQLKGKAVYLKQGTRSKVRVLYKD